jgi:hypothetical protein
VNEGMDVGRAAYRRKGMDNDVLVLGKITHLRLFAVEGLTRICLSQIFKPSP